MSYVLNLKSEYGKLLTHVSFKESVHERRFFFKLNLVDTHQAWLLQFRYRDSELEQNLLHWVTSEQPLQLEAYYFNFNDSKSVPNGQKKLLVDYVLEIDFLAADDLLCLQHVWPACDPHKKSVQTSNIG